MTPEAIAGYRAYWDRRNQRPLLGFDASGFFPLDRFGPFRAIPEGTTLTAGMLTPRSFLEDYASHREAMGSINDDLIRGVAPIPAVPWLEAMVGCSVLRAPGSLWAHEQHCAWSEAIGLVENARASPWRALYGDFLDALMTQADGRYPVGQPILRGPTDLFGAIRGHEQSLVDALETPEKASALLHQCGQLCVEVVSEQVERVRPFHGGWFVEQYGLWSPEPIIRFQEDASALFSPDLYRKVVLGADRLLAAALPRSLLHLHSSSLFLLDLFLEIDAIDVFQINRDTVGMEIAAMLPALQRVQKAGRLLLIRGPLRNDELELIREGLDHRGLMIQVVVPDPEEARSRLPFARSLWP